MKKTLIIMFALILLTQGIAAEENNCPDCVCKCDCDGEQSEPEPIDKKTELILTVVLIVIFIILLIMLIYYLLKGTPKLPDGETRYY